MVLPQLLERYSFQRDTPYSTELQRYYSGQNFHEAYKKIWRVLLSQSTIRKRCHDRRYRRDEQVWGVEFFKLAAMAQSVGFQTKITTDASQEDPDVTVATKLLDEQARIRGVEFNNTESVATLAQILREIGEKTKQDTVLYAKDNYISTKDRVGTKVWPPQDIKVFPPQGDNLGVTGVYVAVATFNTFFDSPTYAEDSDPEDTDVEDTDVEDTDVEMGDDPDIERPRRVEERRREDKKEENWGEMEEEEASQWSETEEGDQWMAAQYEDVKREVESRWQEEVKREVMRRWAEEKRRRAEASEGIVQHEERKGEATRETMVEEEERKAEEERRAEEEERRRAAMREKRVEEVEEERRRAAIREKMVELFTRIRSSEASYNLSVIIKILLFQTK